MYDLNTIGGVPDDLGTRLVFENVRVSMLQLVEAAAAAGRTLSGLTFIDCVIHGPCVIVPGGQTRFDDCNMGNDTGDVRNLFLRAAGTAIIGALFVNDCRFDGCLFLGVGFAGDDAFVDAFVDQLSPKESLIP